MSQRRTALLVIAAVFGLLVLIGAVSAVVFAGLLVGGGVEGEIVTAEPDLVSIPAAVPDDVLFADSAAGSCEEEGGFAASDGSLLYCLGPVELDMATALESWKVIEPVGAVGPTLDLVFLAGADGIDGFNELAARCFLGDPTCPTKQIAIVNGRNVLTAPTINAPSFERDQITVSSGANPVTPFGDELFAGAVTGGVMRSVLWLSPLEAN